MSVRMKWLNKLREQLEESNEKVAERAADLAVAVSKKADEDDTRDVVRGIMETLEFLPSLVMFALNITFDKRVPIGEKIKIGVLVTLLISPADVLLMELVGPLALMDDVVLIGYLIYSIGVMISNLDEEVIQDNWIGNPEHADQFVEAVRSLAGFSGVQRIGRTAAQQVETD